nr:transposase [Catenibacterium mitsuokai]
MTLGSEFGKELKKQRSIQVEGAFGVIKEYMGFTRFRRRGM